MIRARVLMIKTPMFCPNSSTSSGGVQTGHAVARGFTPAAAARHPKFGTPGVSFWRVVAGQSVMIISPRPPPETPEKTRFLGKLAVQRIIRERTKDSGKEREKERVPCERTQTPKDMYVYRHVFIIHTCVHASFRPVLALRLCPSFPTFPYRFLLLFLLFLLFLFLSRTLSFTGKSPKLHGSLPSGSAVLDPEGATQRPGTTTTVEYGGPFNTHYYARTSINIPATERVRLGCVAMHQMVILAQQHDCQFARQGGLVRLCACIAYWFVVSH